MNLKPELKFQLGLWLRLTNILRPNCATTDEFLSETEERQDRTSDREDGGSSTVNKIFLKILMKIRKGCHTIGIYLVFSVVINF